ncbi:3-dehydroquinate dehydratase [subsurface metagenome]
MKRPRICASIVDNGRSAIKGVEPFIDLYEVRIDLIGDGWPGVIPELKKPWIACNRLADEGGKWGKNEASRIAELLRAIDLGADIIDIELRTKNLDEVVRIIKKRAKCLLSFHDSAGTPPLDNLKRTIERQLAAGADICKVVTTASNFDDNLTVLQLITEFSELKIVSFAMGPLGSVSRVLCPLVGGYFTYASIEEGRESASGQITVRDLRKLYEMIKL